MHIGFAPLHDPGFVVWFFFLLFFNVKMTSTDKTTRDSMGAFFFLLETFSCYWHPLCIHDSDMTKNWKRQFWTETTNYLICRNVPRQLQLRWFSRLFSGVIPCQFSILTKDSVLHKSLPSLSKKTQFFFLKPYKEVFQAFKKSFEDFFSTLATFSLIYSPVLVSFPFFNYFFFVGGDAEWCGG